MWLSHNSSTFLSDNKTPCIYLREPVFTMIWINKVFCTRQWNATKKSKDEILLAATACFKTDIIHYIKQNKGGSGRQVKDRFLHMECNIIDVISIERKMTIFRSQKEKGIGIYWWNKEYREWRSKKFCCAILYQGHYK